MNKVIIITVFILLLILLGFFVTARKYKSESNSEIRENVDKIFEVKPEENSSFQKSNQIITGLEAKLGISGTKTENTEFFWMMSKTKDDRKKAVGVKTKINNADLDLIEEINNYFKETGFSEDEFNKGKGVEGEYSGYRMGDLVCAVVLIEKNEKPKGEKQSVFDIEISCGILE